MSAVPTASAAPIADIEQARFDRTLIDLQLADPAARVALSEDTGLAIGMDANVRMAMPEASRMLSTTDRAAAASVLFLDQHGGLFGVPGWHSLEPRYASPLGSTIWFTFAARTRRGEVLVNVCTKDDTVLHVRVTD